MGWCSATDIMDAALAGAEAAVRAVLEEFAPPGSQEADRAKMDEALRPFVKVVAAKLRDGDWDCIEESDYFERFPQEMYGYSDDEYDKHLRDQLKEALDYGEADDVNKWVGQLAAHAVKMKAGK